MNSQALRPVSLVKANVNAPPKYFKLNVNLGTIYLAQLFKIILDYAIFNMVYKYEKDLLHYNRV